MSLDPEWNIELFPAQSRFPQATVEWRDTLFRRVKKDASIAPALSNCDPAMQKTKINEVINTMFVVSKVLAAVRGTPDLGNQVDPLDELIFITLCQRTRIKTALTVFNSIKARYPRWEDVLTASPEDLSGIMSIGGRGNLRVKAVKRILSTIRDQHGVCSLEFLRELPPAQAFTILTDLPWVGEKNARCVLLYSLQHPSFPADAHCIRIFSRTGILEPLVGNLHMMEHRQVQSSIAPLVPPDIAHTLHVNMVAHGQETCYERNPQCSRCEIQLFCAFYRQGEVQRAQSRKYTAIDLFSGAGGLSAGFSEAGFRIQLAADNDKAALRTYSLNHPDVPGTAIVNSDITTLTDCQVAELVTRPVDVLLAGVPCQGYSRVGYRTKPMLMQEKRYTPESDPKNRLFLEVIRIARLLEPRMILLENVGDMEKARVQDGHGLSGVTELLRERLAPEYVTATVLLNASDFGIPQNRYRLFFFAFRQPTLPGIRQSLERMRQEAFADIKLPMTVEFAIGDLPVLAAGEGVQITGKPLPDRATRNPYDLFVFRPTRVLYNHQARNHNEDDMKIICALQDGESYASLLRRCPEIVKDRKHKVYSHASFPDKFFRLTKNRPARTIPAHLAKDGNSFIVPDQNRSLTVREAARIQSFPDTWIFTGSRFDQYRQVGNAVPPLLGHFLARFAIAVLEGQHG